MSLARLTSVKTADSTDTVLGYELYPSRMRFVIYLPFRQPFLELGRKVTQKTQGYPPIISVSFGRYLSSPNAGIVFQQSPTARVDKTFDLKAILCGFSVSINLQIEQSELAFRGFDE